MNDFIDHPMIKPNTMQARIYQQILFSEASRNNSLIILPTGLGKTIIMVMLVAHFLKQKEGKIAIVAPTRPLIDQHYETFTKFLDILEDEIVVVSGSTSPEKRKGMWSSSRVVISTPQTLRNDIVSKTCNLHEMALVCFDEAHRAVGDDPYVLIAEQFKLQNPNGRIAGFTASPRNKEKLLEIVSNLKIENIKHMDEDDPRVKPYIHQTHEEIIWLVMPEQMKATLDLLNEYMKSHLVTLKELDLISSIQVSKINKKLLISIPGKLNKQRENIGDTPFFNGMSAYGQLMLTSQASEMLETQGISILDAFFKNKRDELIRTNKKSLKRFFSSELINKAENKVESILGHSVDNPKIEQLKYLLSQSIDLNKDSRILIFSNYKATVNHIVNQIKDIPGVKSHYFVGQASSQYGKGLNQKQQKNIMDQFRNGMYNVLVSTSVGEEGLDIAQCDLVIFYDITPSSTRLIQRSGRTGRAREGKVVLLIMKGTRDESYYYVSRRRKGNISDDVKQVIKKLNEQKQGTLKPKTASFNDYFDDDNSNEEKIEDKVQEKNNSQLEDLSSPEFIESNRNKNESENVSIKFEDNGDKPKIYIDYREKGSALLRELMLLDIDLVQADLPIGDFIVSSRVAIERKTVHDFCISIVDSRLFQQLAELKRTYIRPILILEGNENDKCSLSKNALNGAISSILVDFNIPVYRTKDQKETIEIIYSMAKREQLKKEGGSKIRLPGKEGSLSEEQISILSSVPNINGILADKLLKHFKSLKNVFLAHPDQLRLVHGIGLNIANRLDVLFSSPYEEDNLFD